MPVHGYSITNNPVDQAIWGQIVEIVNQILTKAKEQQIRVAGLDGKSEPTVNSETIELNGEGDETCEPLIILRDRKTGHKWWQRLQEERARYYRSIKTRGKPYDLVVGAILLVVDNLTEGQLRVEGGGFREDWDRYLKFANEVVGSSELRIPEHLLDYFNNRSDGE